MQYNDTLIQVTGNMLWLLTIITDKQAKIDMRTGKTYLELTDGNGNRVGLQEIGNNEVDLMDDYNPEFFIGYTDFAENTGKYRKFCGKLSDNLRKSIGTVADDLRKSVGSFADGKQKFTGIVADNLQTITGADAEPSRKLIGKGTIDRKSIAFHFAGETKKIVQQCEKLADQICKNTSKTDTHKKTAADIDLMREIAFSTETDRVERLRDVLRELEKRRDKQVRRINQNQTENRMKSPVRKFKIVLTTTLLLLSIASVLFWQLKQPVQEAYNEVKNKVETVTQKVNPDARHYSPHEIAEFIAAYERSTGNRIWDWRTKKIIEAFDSKKMTETEAAKTVMAIAEKEY